MRVSFMQSGYYSSHSYPQMIQKRYEYRQKEHKRAMEDIRYSVAAGALAGVVTAGVMFKKNSPRILFNSLEIGAVVAGFSYLIGLLADKFYNKQHL